MCARDLRGAHSFLPKAEVNEECRAGQDGRKSGQVSGLVRRVTVPRTVHESNAFIPLGMAPSGKQIPRFVGNVGSW